ncbi:MAG: peptidoglycan-binding protein [Oscillospiraceae bacterium]
MSTGTLRVEVFIAREALPLPGALVEIYDAGEWQGENPPIARLTTDESGRTEPVTLYAPDPALSQHPQEQTTPYSVYDAVVSRCGYQPQFVLGIQIFAGVESIQQVEMVPTQACQPEVGVSRIPVHSLMGPPQPSLAEYPDGRITSDVVIPQYVTVHLGRPDDAAAPQVTVSFRNYIKNVASSELYPTWPENALRANIYRQISLVLSRILTGWYHSRGYSFDITNSASYDQAFVHHRNTFSNIDRIVDEIFDIYPQKSNFEKCLYKKDNNNCQIICPNLERWETVTLANRGDTPLGILQHFCKENFSLVQAAQISGVQAAYPGAPLRFGSSGSPVLVIQRQLRRIAKNYPAILKLTADGQFGSATESAVQTFQRIFNLSVDGVVGKATWYQISYIYTAVTQLAELSSEKSMLVPAVADYPGHPLRNGATGESVEQLQGWLRTVGRFYESVPVIAAADGTFTTATENAVKAFQKAFGLAADGIVGLKAWRQLQLACRNLEEGIDAGSGSPPVYPGEALRVGSRGDSVRMMQDSLNAIGRIYTGIPVLAADGIYGAATANAVRTFQRLFGLDADGFIRRATWNRIAAVSDSL